MSCELDTEGPLLTRHCAFCLTEIRGEAIKKCAKCHKRAYCSRKCQSKDWTPNKKGQGHKNWCGTNCGEEDVDWTVCPVPGKGLGIVTLRDIPAAYKIIVEACVDKTHPRVADLMPQDGSLDEKFNLNKCGFGEDDNGSPIVLVCLRLARVNHSCAPNAYYFYDKSVKVNILFALQDIKNGEEVCISYLGFDDIQGPTPDMGRQLLRGKWGITCDQNCLCFNQAHLEKVKRGRELDEALTSLGSAENMPEAQAIGQKCLELQKGLDISLTVVKRTLKDGLVITVKEMKSTAEDELQLLVDYVWESVDFTQQKKRHSEQNEQGKKNEGGQLFSMYKIRVIPS